MTAESECRLLIDAPSEGAWNMAVDEVLLQLAAEEGSCSFRFYGWQEATLSLGYFQAYEERGGHAASRDCPAVRRLTGGGAIVHDRELTYSVALPSQHPLAARRDLLYESVHASLVGVLADLGIVAGLCREAGRAQGGGERFLCFQRRSPGDVLVGDVKIAGSAQRRRRGAVLQHGSVLLVRSSAAPELPALADLAGRVISAGQLAAAWSSRLAADLGFAWRREPLGEEQRRQAGELVRNRYCSAVWTEATGRPRRRLVPRAGRNSRR